MAIYRLEAKIIGRGSGRSAVGAAAYRSGGRLQAKSIVASAAYRAGTFLRDERGAVGYDYSRKEGIVHNAILLPDGAPDWAGDREALWNTVEAVEKRKDAQLAREVLVTLPRELKREDQVALVHSFAQEQFVSRGMIADVAIHEGVASDGLAQPHAHILLTLRTVGPDGFGKKERAWNAAFATKDANSFTAGTDLLGTWRAAWAAAANSALERAGEEARIDHRSLGAQRSEALERGDHARAAELDREPQPKLGTARWMVARLREALDAWRKWVGVQHRNRVRAHARAMRAHATPAGVAEALVERLREFGAALGFPLEPEHDPPGDRRGMDHDR